MYLKLDDDDDVPIAYAYEFDKEIKNSKGEIKVHFNDLSYDSLI